MISKLMKIVITIACLMMIKNFYGCTGINFGDFVLCCLTTTFYLIDLWEY